jgi:hypothetical protein
MMYFMKNKSDTFKIGLIHSLWHHVHRDHDVTLCHDQTRERDIRVIDRDNDHSRIRIIATTTMYTNECTV